MNKQTTDGSHDTFNDKESFVFKDRIWTDYINKVTYSAQTWSDNWGFMDINNHQNDKVLNYKRKVIFNLNYTPNFVIFYKISTFIGC
jgi:hypothetical protein